MTVADVYLTESEFAGRYHLGRRTVQRWRRTGEGPAWVRLGQRRVLYRLSDCETWAAARTFRHRADELARQITAAACEEHSPPLAAAPAD
jgi:predicted DNA-binding transcriptional regulator AlpA